MSKRCDNCGYYKKLVDTGGTGGQKACHYILITGISRNSSPDNCDKWVKAVKKKKSSNTERITQ